MLHLTEERAELDPPFMVDKSIWKKPATIAAFEDSGAQVDVLAITHRSKASQSLVNAFLDAKVEAAGIESVHFLLAATYAARGEKRGHRVVDGFLYGRERIVCTVGTTKGVARLSVQLFFDAPQVVSRNDDIRIQDDEVVALAVLSTVVA